MTFRPMAMRDIDAVHAIERQSFPNPWHVATFVGEVQNRNISHPFVAVAGEEQRVVGYVIFWLIEDEAQINNIAVHPDWRRKGIGEALLRFALDAMRDMGGVCVSLEVRASNAAAIELYKKYEFALLGVRKGYYHNPAEDALVMGVNL